MSSRRPRAGTRRASTSALRRATESVLLLGTVLAVAAMFGPLWLVRTGVVVAVGAGVLACTLGWRELRSVRRLHAQAMLSASQRHRAAMTQERDVNTAVLDALVARLRSAQVLNSGQRVSIAALREQMAALNGDKAQLGTELARRDIRISSLRKAVAARDAELSSLRGEPTAEVAHLPRRLAVGEDNARSEAATQAGQEFPSGHSGSGVVDLLTIQTAMVLPNYEDDRRVG